MGPGGGDGCPAAGQPSDTGGRPAGAARVLDTCPPSRTASLTHRARAALGPPPPPAALDRMLPLTPDPPFLGCPDRAGRPVGRRPGRPGPPGRGRDGAAGVVVAGVRLVAGPARTSTGPLHPAAGRAAPAVPGRAGRPAHRRPPALAPLHHRRSGRSAGRGRRERTAHGRGRPGHSPGRGRLRLRDDAAPPGGGRPRRLDR